MVGTHRVSLMCGVDMQFKKNSTGCVCVCVCVCVLFWLVTF